MKKPETLNLSPKTYLFYLDTSEEKATLALFLDNKIVQKVEWQAGRELSKTLSQKYLELIKVGKVRQEKIAEICVFAGPGSFTGLRIGISFANALAFTLDIPVTKTTTKLEIDNRQKVAENIVVPEYEAEPKITTPKGQKR